MFSKKDRNEPLKMWPNRIYNTRELFIDWGETMVLWGFLKPSESFIRQSFIQNYSQVPSQQVWKVRGSSVHCRSSRCEMPVVEPACWTHSSSAVLSTFSWEFKIWFVFFLKVRPFIPMHRYVCEFMVNTRVSWHSANQINLGFKSREGVETSTAAQKEMVFKVHFELGLL